MNSDTRWNPEQYGKFGDERGRPFADLAARIDCGEPEVVLDLGCGNGPLTLSLADRWPQARVIGVDHSPQMLAAAAAVDREGRVTWVEADLREWSAESLAEVGEGAGAGAPDVVVTNATLQWVPEHLELIDRIVEALRPGGWFAMQVPDNLDAPSHALMREVAAEPSRAAELAVATRRLGVERPEVYLDRWPASAAPSMCGRRRTSTCSIPPGRSRTQSSNGSAAPDCARCSRCSPTTESGRSSWRRIGRGCARHTPGLLPVSCCRSGARSPSPTRRASGSGLAAEV